MKTNGGRFLGIFTVVWIALLGMSARAAIPTAERDALIALYNSTAGDDWAQNDNWQKEPDVFNDPGTECTWYGVTCNAGETTVTKLDLDFNWLVGSIPPELADLVNLQVLSFSGPNLSSSPPRPPNWLNGTIPQELGSLGDLRTLDLGGNELTGTIPSELGNLTNLRSLGLGENRLTGSIPPELGNLANLESLWLWSNQLTGTIPPELGDLTSLNQLTLWKNQLTGTIPLELGNLSNLLDLSLGYNRLTGSIPPELGNLTNLWGLDLGINQLTGSIPPELGNLASLQSLDLSTNHLTGTIPSELASLVNLQYLYLQENQLSGTLPPELATLTNLRSLDLENNQLTGSVPAELGTLAELHLLTLNANQLTGSIPADLGNLTHLEALGLADNQLTGSIPLELGNLTSLYLLNLRSNLLTGPIPPELGNLAELWFLELGDNQLSGPVPPQLAALASLQIIDLRNNQLFTDHNALREFLNSKQRYGDWESFQTLNRQFAQFADGGGLVSQIVLFNLNDTAAATGQIEILDDSGEAMNVSLNGEAFSGSDELSVPATGLLSLRTDGIGDVQTGSVRVTTDRHVEGVVIFGGTTGLAGVGSSPNFSAGFVAPIERNESLGINTGIAVTVLSDQEANLNLTLLDAGGSTLAHATDTLAAQGHKALFVTEVPWDVPVDLSDFRGTLVVTSSQPVTATVLQTRPSELVTLPVAPLQPASMSTASDHRLYFAQFADGESAVSSQILLFNLSEENAATAQLSLRDDSGSPLSVDLGGETVTGEKQVEIGPRALAVLATDGLGDLQKGSVTVVSDEPLAGVVIFAGPTVGAAGVGNSVELPEGFVAPMETNQSSGINTGVAVMNLEDADQALDADLLDDAGQKLASAQVPLATLGHTALFVTEIPWDQPVDFSHFEGLLRIRSEGRTAATVIQTRPGQFATMPVAPKPKD